MKIRLRPFFSLILSVSVLYSYCQVINAKKCDSTAHFPITSYSYFLRSTKPISLDSVIKSQNGFIKADNKAVLVFNYDPYCYWFRFIIKNSQDQAQASMILMAPIGLYNGQLFQKNKGKWIQVAQTGLKYKFQERSYQSTHYVFPFLLPPQTVDTLYLSIDASNAYKSVGFALLQPKGLKIFENQIYFIFGIIIGLLILFFVVNIALFFALNDKLHLWYALYIALLFLVVMKNDQLDQQFLGWDSEAAFRLTPYMTIGALAIAVLIHVVQSFLKSFLIDSKVLYQLSIILKLNVLCSAVIHAFVFYLSKDYLIESIVFAWAKFSTLLGICIIIADCIYCIKKLKSAYFLLFGSFVFLLGSVQRIFFPSTLSFLFPPTTFHIGIILEVFVISAGLIYRYRTEKKSQQEREDNIQTKTLEFVSRQFHDNVGQKLTVVNLQIMSFIRGYAGKITLNDLTEIKEEISAAIVHLRDLSKTLKKDSEPRVDLIEQIEKERERIKKTFVIDLVFKHSGDVLGLENINQLIVISIIKEAIQNAIKHSEASKIEILLIYKAKTLLIRISDNGTGFDLSSVMHRSNGLKNMESNCLLLNATYHLESQIKNGTIISFEMPVLKDNY